VPISSRDNNGNLTHPDFVEVNQSNVAYLYLIYTPASAGVIGTLNYRTLAPRIPEPRIPASPHDINAQRTQEQR
jgi:hypothetical protein